jgi:hypothetical protein
MTRQSLAQLCVSPVRLQQGLFASLALMVTLIGGQQLQHWQQQTSHFERPAMPQTHFRPIDSRSVGSVSVDVTAPQLRMVDQASALSELPSQERWVF